MLYVKRVLCFIGIVAITIGFIFLAYYLEIVALSNRVLPPPNITIEQWLDKFKRWATVGISVSGLTSLLWYVLGQWGFDVIEYRKAGKRHIWILLFLLPVVVAIIAACFTRHAQSGAWLAYVFYGLNGLLCYYLATALCSPLAFKYTPSLASKVWRRWW